MIFSRTSSGLRNMHKFLGVDAVVFVEGGVSLSFEDVLNGQFNDSSVDVGFWRNIFGLFSDKKKYQFRAVGSKANLMKLAERKIDENIETYFIAMDKDHDFIKEEMLNSPGIFYTYGYSWENDIWNLHTCSDVFYGISNKCDKTVDISTELSELMNNFERKFKKFVYLDAILSLYDKSFFPRKDDGDRFFKHGTMGVPLINNEQLKQIIVELKKNRNLKYSYRAEKGKSLNICAFYNCYGKIISTFSYRIIVYLLKKYNCYFKLHRKYINSFGLRSFTDNLKNGKFSQIHNYYHNQFSFLSS
jgi:hypothetical protein